MTRAYFELDIIGNPDECAVPPVEALITKHGGVIKGCKLYGKKKLAYPIAKYDCGFYYEWLMEFDKDEIPELLDDLNTTDAVLRYLCVMQNEKELHSYWRKEMEGEN